MTDPHWYMVETNTNCKAISTNKSFKNKQEKENQANKDIRPLIIP